MKLMSEGDWSFHLPSSLRTYVTEALPYELLHCAFSYPVKLEKGLQALATDLITALIQKKELTLSI